MDDLYGQLAAKMTERPETNTATSKVAVTKWLVSDRDHICLTYELPTGVFDVAITGSGAPALCPVRWAVWPTGGDGPEPAGLAGLAALVAGALPCPAESSVYRWPRAGQVSVLAFATCAGPLDDHRVLHRLTRGGQPLPPGFQEPLRPGVTLAQWWRDVDAGMLSCLDSELASAHCPAELHAEPDGGYVKLVLDGQEYRAPEPVRLTGPLDFTFIPDTAAMAASARQTEAARHAAATALHSLDTTTRAWAARRAAQPTAGPQW